MSVTHGGRARNFDWSVKGGELLIESESGIEHRYTLKEIFAVLKSLHTTFGEGWFPLANNVEKMYHETERPGLGTAIYELSPGDTAHAQGASYLGVILEERGIFEWNGATRGICWRISNKPRDLEALKAALSPR